MYNIHNIHKYILYNYIVYVVALLLIHLVHWVKTFWIPSQINYFKHVCNQDCTVSMASRSLENLCGGCSNSSDLMDSFVIIMWALWSSRTPFERRPHHLHCSYIEQPSELQLTVCHIGYCWTVLRFFI